jgi:hypothetical protein
MYRLSCRKLVALAAAYAVALNLVLPLLSIFAPAADAGALGLSEICGNSHSGPGSGADFPNRHGPICPFGMACSASDCGAASLPAGGGIAAFSFGPAPLGLFLRLDDEVLPLRNVGAQFARAPPLA